MLQYFNTFNLVLTSRHENITNGHYLIYQCLQQPIILYLYSLFCCKLGN